MTAEPAAAAPYERRQIRNDTELLARVAEWLNANVLPDWRSVRFVSLSRISGGVSYETWIVDVEDPGSPSEHTERLVLRREPLRGPFEPYDIAHEAKMIGGLAKSDVPVPVLLGHCSDPAVAGRPFIVLEYVEGDVPDYRTIMKREDWQDERRRARMADELVRVLADLQRVDWTQPPLTLPAPASERERMHGLIDEMLESGGRRTSTWVPHPIFRDAGHWCKENAPDGDTSEMVLIHADFRVGNFIWRDDRIVAFLDWEGAMVGDPLQDLGYACHPAMREARPDLMTMLAPLDEFVDRYERFTERQVDMRRLHYYVVYSLFFQTWTLMVGIPSIVEWDGDMRLATAYGKLNQLTRLLTAEIEAYEEGRGVL
jgi:aminoglycoside phosphotransferase (APT) family kinase protein